MEQVEEILKYFPNTIYKIVVNLFEQKKEMLHQLQEIRLRVQKPILLKMRQADIVVDYQISQTEILQMVERLCENSIYAYKNQICEGFITIRGGHRVGLTGSCVMENGNIINIKYISSLNIRIAREIKNCSNLILKEVIDTSQNTIFNTMIVSPPGKGKTTILRDTIRRISDGIPELQFTGKTCGVIDERGEIAACYKGIPQNDVGIRTDVIENICKQKGIEMLIRSMSPEVIACDEIGNEEDVQAIKRAIISGVKGIFTMHGKNQEDVNQNKAIYQLIENKMIEKILFLG